ncbi:hypothetical protein AB4Z52_33140 [Rhizobium sp. 2YAF20]|uniref:hypothetical protein n=1 Tax=Rhizobium sp. 2YAF20 TaxID=3233027 RepID=UPI003F9E1BB7
MNKQTAHEMTTSEIMVKLHRGRLTKKLHALLSPTSFVPSTRSSGIVRNMR